MSLPPQAPYTRFDMYIPTVYSYRGQDKVLDYALVQNFSTQTASLFGGLTQSDPLANPLRGWWIPGDAQPASIDQLTYIFALVRSTQHDAALQHFNMWKRRFEKKLHQQIILVTFYHVNVLGGFL